MIKNSEKIQLVKDVLGTELGIRLLDVLKDELSAPLFDEHANSVYYKIGKVDLLTTLKAYVDLPQSELDKVAEAEKISEEDELNLNEDYLE